MPVVGPRFPHAHLQRPQVVFAPAPPTQQQQTIGVQLATHARRGWNRRFPPQWYEGSETKTTPGAAFPLSERSLGPDPPVVIDVSPDQQQQTISVTLAAQSRRLTDSRRYPLPGWIANGAVDALSGIYGYRRNLGPFPPTVQGPLPSLQQQTVPVSYSAAVANARRYMRHQPLQGWDGCDAHTATDVGFLDVSLSASSQALTDPTRWRAQSFTADHAGTVTGVRLMLKTGSGTPTDQLQVEIRTDNGNKPSAVVLGTAFVNANDPYLPDQFAATPVPFYVTGLSAPVAAGSRYWIVVRRTGSLDASNYLVWYLTPGNGTDYYSGGDGADSTDSGATWTVPFPGVARDWQFLVSLQTSQVIGLTSRLLGPRPPLLIALSPSQQQQMIGVTLAVNASRRSQRHYPLPGEAWVESLQGGSQAAQAETYPATSGGQIFGSSGSDAAAIFFPNVSGLVDSVQAPIQKLGSPTDNVYAQLYLADGAGGRPGTAIGNPSAVVSGASLPISGTAFTTFTFADPVQVAQGVWVAFFRDGALSGTNRYRWLGGPYGLLNATFSGGWSPVFNTTLVGSGSVNYTPFVPGIVLRRGFLGPQPPLLQGPLPPQQQQTISSTYAQAVERRAVRRFPLQGWRQVLAQQLGVADQESGGINYLNSGTTFGETVIERRTESIVISRDAVLAQLSLFLRTAGAPTDDLVVQVQSDSGGSPSGVVLAQINYPAASLTSTLALYVRDIGLPLTAGTYWLVFSRSGALDSTNRYAVGSIAPTNPALLEASFISGGWSFSTLTDHYYGLTLLDPVAPGSLAYTERYLGPKPPQLVTFAPVTPGIEANLLPVDRLGRRYRRRATQPQLFPPIIPAGAFVAPPISTNFAPGTGKRTRRKPISSLLAPPVVLQTFGGPATSLVRARPRRRSLSLPGPTVVQLPAFTGPQVNLVGIAARRTWRRPHSQLAAPAVVTIPAFAGPTTRVTRIRPRRRKILFGGPIVVQLPAFPGPTVVLARTTRPRRARSVLPQTIAAAAAAIVATPITVASTRVRRPRTVQPQLRVPTTLQVFTGPTVALARIRPRPTGRRLVAPQVVRVPSVEQLEQTIKATFARVRPRPTRRTLAPPTALQVFAVGTVHLVETRPRPTAPLLAPPTLVRVPSVEQAEQTVRVTLARARPRHTLRTLRGPVVLQTFAGLTVSVVHARPRPTATLLAPPTATRTPSVEQQEQTVRTWLVATRAAQRRHTHWSLTAVSYPQTSEIAVASVARGAARPRPTTFLLAPPAVLQVFAGPRVALTRTRPRPTRAELAAPIVVRVPSVEQLEQTVRTWAVRARPRPIRTLLAAPTVLHVFAGPPPRPVRARPRPTRTLVAPPTVVLPLPTLRVETITVALARTRPRPTARRLQPPTTLVAPQPPTLKQQTIKAALQAVPLRGTLQRRRPLYELGRPVVVNPLPTLKQQTVQTFAVRIRPRSLRARLAQPTALLTFRGPTVYLVRAQPRRLASALGAPLAAPVFAGLSVRLVTARTRPTIRRLYAPATLEPESVALLERDVRVLLTRTRPRVTTKALRPPTALAVFAARTATPTRPRPRRTTFALAAPAIVAARFTAPRVRAALARVRPRPVRYRIAPPRAVAAFHAEPVRVRLAPAARRPGLTRLPSIPVLAPAATTPTIRLTPARRPIVASRLSPPQPATPTAEQLLLHVTLARARPRPTVARLTPPTVVAPPLQPVVAVLLVALAAPPTPQRVFRSRLAPPTILVVPRSGVTSGYVVPADAADGNVIAAAATDGDPRPAAASDGQEAPASATTITAVPASRADGRVERSDQ